MHVIVRGIDRSAVFFADSDHRFFLGCLESVASREGVAVHASLMTNHVHLLMPVDGEKGVPAVMKRVAQRYVQYVNRVYRRTGGFFVGRFRLSLIEADAIS
jgi:putative transposase